MTFPFLPCYVNISFFLLGFKNQAGIRVAPRPEYGLCLFPDFIFLLSPKFHKPDSNGSPINRFPVFFPVPDSGPLINTFSPSSITTFLFPFSFRSEVRSECSAPQYLIVSSSCLPLLSPLSPLTHMFIAFSFPPPSFSSGPFYLFFILFPSTLSHPLHFFPPFFLFSSPLHFPKLRPSLLFFFFLLSSVCFRIEGLIRRRWNELSFPVILSFSFPVVYAPPVCSFSSIDCMQTFTKSPLLLHFFPLSKRE